MIPRPPRSTPLSLHDALPISGVLEIITPETNSAFAAYVCRMASDCCALGANLDNLRTVTTNEELSALHDRLINVRNQERNLDYIRFSLEEYGEFPRSEERRVGKDGGLYRW